MAKQNILIVDSDPESVKVLEVSLKKVGYSVTTARDGMTALEVVGFSSPDLVISDTQMPGLDGFELCTKLKENEEWSKIPFIFLTADKSIENKIRGLELGVDDYLNKPIFIREILVRVNLAIQRRQKERLERRGTKSKFSGNLQDMGVVDLLQTIDLGHKSGVLHIIRINDEGNIYFRDGQVIDASTRTRIGADAVYRLLVWSDGTFEIEFTNVDRAERIRMSTQGLLMEGMRRLDEWGRLQEQLPPLTAVYDVDEQILAERLGEIPDEVNSVLKHFDGHATLLEVVDNGALGDLEALTLISKLYFEGLITEIHPTSPSDGVLDPNALLPEPADTWVHSRPPQQHVPSRVVDDALGPHLSVAAQFAGLSGNPTNAPAAPLPVPSVVPNASDTVLGLSRVKEVPSVTIIKPSIVVALPEKPDTAGTTGNISDIDFPSQQEIETLTFRKMTDPGKIAAAIDAELPPPDESQDETRPDEPAYFEGATYRASMGPELSPAPFRTRMASPVPMEQNQSSVSLSHEAYDDLDNLDDQPTHPKRLKLAVAAVLVLLTAGFAAGYGWWKSQHPSSDIEPDRDMPKKSASAAVVSKKATALPKAVPTQPSALQKKETTPAPAPTTDTSPDIKMPTSPENAAAPSSETTSSAVPIQKKLLTPEEKKAFDDLMKDIDKSGRRKKILIYQQALEIDPTSDVAMAGMAIQLLETTQTRPKAMAYADKAIAVNPDNAVAWLAKGYIYQLNDQPDKAKAAYRRCAECSGPAMYTLECRRLSR